jgi:hypothetical protein
MSFLAAIEAGTSECTVAPIGSSLQFVLSAIAWRSEAHERGFGGEIRSAVLGRG